MGRAYVSRTLPYPSLCVSPGLWRTTWKHGEFIRRSRRKSVRSRRTRRYGRRPRLQFDAASHPKNPGKVYRGGGGQFSGRTLGVLGDFQYVWEVGRIMSGKPPNPSMYPGMLCNFTGCPVS
jgi:hypothetical protein